MAKSFGVPFMETSAKVKPKENSTDLLKDTPEATKPDIRTERFDIAK